MEAHRDHRLIPVPGPEPWAWCLDCEEPVGRDGLAPWWDGEPREGEVGTPRW